MSKGRLAPDQCHHAAHAGGTLGRGDIQFLVLRSLSDMAARAQVVRSPNLQRAQHSQSPLRSQFPVDGGSTTRAGDFAFVSSASKSSRAALAPTGENDLQQ